MPSLVPGICLLLRRVGYDKKFVSEVASVMEYSAVNEAYREEIEIAKSNR
ncbi:MAG: hypothetical protein AB7T86_02695 [Xanthobacteraceae bacterium]